MSNSSETAERSRSRWLRQSDRAITQGRARRLLSCGCPRCVKAWQAADNLPGNACDNGKAWLAETAGMRPLEIIAHGQRRHGVPR